MRYLPQTDAEIAEMLQVIGKASVDELFHTIPEAARFQGLLAVPPALDEPSLMDHLTELSEKSEGARMLSFLGAGMYSHHIPPAVDQLLLRSEFLTSYTPYQPEVAQGTLQAIWEFQTIVSELFGLPLANASMYDGASATAEAAQMARRLTKRDRLVVSQTVHPEYIQVTQTYLGGRGDEASLVEVPVAATGGDDLSALLQAADEQTAAVIVGYPSFFGALTDLRPLATALHERGVLLISATSEPYALGVAESPGALGVDIAVGEGQALAVTPNFGGPGVGLFTCRDDRRFLQQLPGRIAGETTDTAGERGFVLTLATREQHIRRERATSNICTNQGLIALALAIRTSLLGKTGFQRVAATCLSKASYLRDAILKLEGYQAGFDPAPFFNEFTVRVRGGDAARVCRALEAEGIIAGYDVKRSYSSRAAELLIAVTERHSVAELDRLVKALDRV